jgi:hypothetical protein
MIQHNNFLLVEVPFASMNHIITPDDKKIMYRFDNGSWGEIQLPTGNYSIVGMAKDIDEKTAQDIFGFRPEARDFPFDWYKAQIRSLLASHSLKENSTIVLKKND